MKKCLLISALTLVYASCAATAVAAKRDRDHDGLPDRWERHYKLSTKRPSARKDLDRDHLNNRREYRHRTNPRRFDTDRDGLGDGAEVKRFHTNPRKADTDGDGYSDRLELRKHTNPRDAHSVPQIESAPAPQPPAAASAPAPPAPPAPAPPAPPAPGDTPPPGETPPPGIKLEPVDGGLDWYGKFSNPLPTTASFFPIAVWFESVTSAADIAIDKAAGLNTYVELTGNSDLGAVRSAGMHAIHSGDPVGEGSETNGWLTVDEPDMWAGPGHAAWTGNFPGEGDICSPDGAACGYTVLRTIDSRLPADGRMRYTNFGKGIAFWESDAEASEFLNGGYQDLISTDTYWFTDNNICSQSEGGALLNGGTRPLTSSECHRAANYGATVQRERALAGESRPVWGFVELGHPFSEDDWPSITAGQVQAAVWHSLIAGARGMIYFNHSFGGPHQTQHALRDPAYGDIRAAVTAVDRRIAALAPVLNAPTVTRGWSHSSGTKAMVKWSGGKLWLFAGSAGSATSGSFTLPCAGDATATVLDESRMRPIRSGTFTDDFADGNAVHVYRIDDCTY